MTDPRDPDATAGEPEPERNKGGRPPKRRQDRELMRARGRQGGLKAQAQLRAQRGNPDPYLGDFQQFLTDAGLVGETWAAWRVFWKAVDAIPLAPDELAIFQRHTGRQTPPAAPVREVWDIVGRRGGKTRVKAARALWTAIRRNWRAVLAEGERCVIPIIAADRRQAGQALGYIKGLLARPGFAAFATRRVLTESVELTTGVTVEVHTASFKTTRGYTCPAVVGDEVAFWSSEDSASPDVEILQALRPTMSTIPGALLACGSTPYAQRGALFATFEKYYGHDDAVVLVWVADTLSMHRTPQLAQDIARAFADDPAAAASEYGQDGRVAFRTDVQAFLSREAVEAVTLADRRELPWQRDIVYVAFADPSGGSQDSFTLAIAHRDPLSGRAVLDCVREVRPKFNPDAVCEEFAGVLQTYGLAGVTGDRYAGLWPTERFAAHGVTYAPAAVPKSDIYRQLLPAINSGRVELLDLPVLQAQLQGLERRVARGGRESIDHAPGGRDDVANAAAGALAIALEGAGAPADDDDDEVIQWWERATQRPDGRLPFTFE
jgi:hypothetical protein